MSLRLRLALAFLLLSALPLGAFAVYSYTSSEAALRVAAQAEAESTARELEQRVASATAELDRRLRVLSSVPIETWVSAPAVAGETPSRRIAPELAELDQALPYLENLRFVPETPSAPAEPTPPAEPAEPAPAVAAVAPPSAPTPPTPLIAPAAPVASAAPTPLIPAIPGVAGLAAVSIALPAAEKDGTLFVEIAKLQTEALQAAAAATRMKGRKFEELGLEQMAAQFEKQAKEIELAAVDRARVREATAEARKANLAVREASRASARESARAGAASRAHAAARSKPELQCAVTSGERVVGKLQAKIKGEQLFHSVLGKVDRRRGEIPFALGTEQSLIASSSADAERLEAIPALAALRGRPVPASRRDEWIVVSREDPSTGYRLGIARPLSGAMAELKRAVAANFALGMALVGVATVGFFPLTSRFVRSVRELDLGAARIAAGDLATRVEVRGKDELGRLGASFNRMAEQLAHHREQLLAEERRRKEEEISRRLLAAENERRGRELEEAREFQLSLLPRELPKIAGLDLAVEMTTATEVGGDYYDFQLAPGGELVLAIGDATGHGAAAGTLVMAVKSLFAAAALAASPAAFLASANAAIYRMGLVRRAMALTVARTQGGRVALSAAGMPPVLHFRASAGMVDELVVPGTPLGSRAEFPYTEVEVELAPGDALLFLSDGLPELPNEAGEPFGYERLRAEFGRLANQGACEIVGGLRAAAREWAGARAPEDDMTLLAVRRT